jgi:hypothetical protein
MSEPKTVKVIQNEFAYSLSATLGPMSGAEWWSTHPFWIRLNYSICQRG